ncbi:MAG: glycosyltransferase family 2 protein [Planctomycetota bacterium]
MNRSDPKMDPLLYNIAVAIGSVLILPTLAGSLELLLLTFGAILPRGRKAFDGDTPDLRLAIVVPSHNEEASIGACVRSLDDARQGDERVQIVVVADNCEDATAQVAKDAGARVLERNNLEERGKGHALAWAFDQLLEEEHDAFVVVDADSEVDANFYREIQYEFANGADALQCRYLVSNPGDSLRTRLMNVALMAFNVLRPLGRHRLGLSAGIYGNGFALSRKTISEVPYAAHSVVEDLEYHLHLLRAGKRVRFVNTTTVRGEMPNNSDTASSQRARWEGGRFLMIREHAPKLLSQVLRGKLRYVEPLLDLVLLPLAYHVAVISLAAIAPDPIRTIALASIGIVAFHVLVAVRVGGGGLKELMVLASAPFYIVWKLSIARHIAKTSKRDAGWVRTTRNQEREENRELIDA